MKKLFEALRTPRHERIELAVQKRAYCASEVEYHRLLSSHYAVEMTKVNPHDSVESAFEFARLFQKYEEHIEEREREQRKLNDAIAKHEALVASA